MPYVAQCSGKKSTIKVKDDVSAELHYITDYVLLSLGNRPLKKDPVNEGSL